MVIFKQEKFLFGPVGMWFAVIDVKQLAAESFITCKQVNKITFYFAH